jgi:hypothetical protein
MAIVEHTAGETRRERRLLVEEAGYTKVSFISVAAGVLAAYGAFALLAAAVGGIVRGFGVETDVGNYDWETVGGVGTGVVAVALFLGYLFGGYVAGRMAFRSGILHGFLVFLLGIIVAGLVGLLVGSLTGTEAIEENLRNVGVPTTADEWGAIGTIAGIVSLVAMIAGAMLGGMWGERWYGKLLRRAASENYGPDVDDRADRDRDGVDDRDEVAVDRDRDGVDDRDEPVPVTRATAPSASTASTAPTSPSDPDRNEVRAPADVDRPVRAPSDVERPTTVRAPQG